MIIFLFCGCSAPVENSAKPVEKETVFVKSVWITYYEMQSFLKNKTEDEFCNDFSNTIDYLKDLGFNTITVQCRAFSDAFYNSCYYPTSAYFVANQGDNAPFDPLSDICKIAGEKGVNVEAWINPYRVSNSPDFDKLSNDNPAKKWKDTNTIIVTKSGIYYNPASNEITELITNGVEEIVKNYNITAIHFDDYFYPSDVANLDKDDYKKSNTDLSLAEWRRENVTSMIKSVKKAINDTKPNVKFGISPSANIRENQNTLFADVESWVGDNSLIDYICPQIYYGFKNETMPFIFTTKKWLEITNVDMFVGLPLYKVGKEDKHAGIGKKEFLNDNIINRQIEYLSKINKVKGIYIFSYSSLKDNENQIAKLKEI